MQFTAKTGTTSVPHLRPQKLSLPIYPWTETGFAVALQTRQQAALSGWWREVAHGARHGAAIQFWAKAS